jgi:hypothetical protein
MDRDCERHSHPPDWVVVAPLLVFLALLALAVVWPR